MEDGRGGMSSIMDTVEQIRALEAERENLMLEIEKLKKDDRRES